MIINTLHKERNLQKVNAGKSIEENCENRQEKVNLRTYKKFTRRGLNLVSVHQEPPCSGIFKKGATTGTFLISRHS